MMLSRFARTAARRLTLTIVVAGCSSATAGDRSAMSDAELLHLAVKQLTNIMIYDIFSPPQASRAYAYSSVAAYEALRAGDETYRSFAGQLRNLKEIPPPPSEISKGLAGVHAYLTVGRALTFSRARMDSIRTDFDDRFRRRQGMTPEVFARSVAYGDTVASHILAWAGADGYLQTRGGAKYTVTNVPGRWVPTPPAYMDAVEPNWNKIRPFVMDSASEFRPEGPLAFDTARTSPYMREAMEVQETRRNLTNEQREIAGFWDCNPYVMHVQGHTMFATKKVTPGGHWMGIVATASRRTNADALHAAEAYARTSVAVADGFISAWDEKFRSNMVRPETVINTWLDEGWEPLLQTPPFPEYPSAHSVISAAAAQVLTDLFGKNFAFVDSTEIEYGITPRSFTSFEQASAEAAISRLYGGIHYRRAVEQGVAEGRRVGQHVLARVHTRAQVAAAPGGAPGH